MESFYAIKEYNYDYGIIGKYDTLKDAIDTINRCCLETTQYFDTVRKFVIVATNIKTTWDKADRFVSRVTEETAVAYVEYSKEEEKYIFVK